MDGIEKFDILVTLLDYGANIVTSIGFVHHLHHTMVAIPTQGHRN